MVYFVDMFVLERCMLYACLELIVQTRNENCLSLITNNNDTVIINTAEICYLEHD